MEIRINICDAYNTTIIKNVNTIDEVKDVIKNEIKRFGMTEFNYCWKADGRSLMVYDDEDIVDKCSDADEVVEMMAERIEKFGVAMVWSIVFDEAKGYGTQYEVYVFDMENENYPFVVGGDGEGESTEDALRAAYDLIEQGEEHGTTIEAVAWAIKSAVDGQAKTVKEAVEIAKSEWYK